MDRGGFIGGEGGAEPSFNLARNRRLRKHDQGSVLQLNRRGCLSVSWWVRHVVRSRISDLTVTVRPHKTGQAYAA